MLCGRGRASGAASCARVMRAGKWIGRVRQFRPSLASHSRASRLKSTDATLETPIGDNLVTTLVTGGGGFLGSAIVRRLVGRGESIRTFSRRRYPWLDELGVEQFQGDLTDTVAVERACHGVETVHHTAAIAGIWGPFDRYYQVNTQGTLNVLAAARQAGCRAFVYTSSPSVTFDGSNQEGIDESAPYPDKWLCAYPRTKALAERSVLAADDPQGMRTCALRPHLIWGPGDPHLIPRLIARARQGRLRRIGRGTNLVDMVYVDNAAEAHVRAAQALLESGTPGGKPYFISQGEPVRCWEWINEILAAAGMEPVRRSIPLTVAYVMGALLESGFGLARVSAEPPMTRFLALQLGKHHYFSIEAARRDFGYTPGVSKEEGMRRLAEWLADESPVST